MLERRSREDLETTVRAGVLEYGTAELLEEVGVGERMEQEGSVHHGIELRFDGRGHRIDFADLTDGLSITIYGQQEVVKDLIRARLEAHGKILFEASAESVEDPDTESPKILSSRMASKRRSPATTSPAATALSGSAGAGSRRMRARSTPEPIPLGGSASSSRDRHRRRS